ncbi:MAG: septum formation initiator family protein [Clostridia bacterium]|nr:septum formation initiator family protein [Clostridia bacterium]
MSKKRQIIIKPRFYVLLVLVAAIFFTVKFVQAEQTLRQQAETMAQLDEQIADVRAGNDSLTAQIAAAGSIASVEESARNELGWVYADEIVYVAVDEASEMDLP